MNVLSWSLSALESYPPVRAKGGSFPSTVFQLDRLCLGQAGPPRGPHHGPLHFLVSKIVDDGVAHGSRDGVEEGEKLVFVKVVCAVGFHVREHGQGVEKDDHS